MIPVVGALLGLISGALPEVVKYFKQRQDNKHELDVMRVQIEMQQVLHTQKMEAIEAEADIRQEEILSKLYEPRPTALSGIRWIDGFTNILNSIADFAIRITRPAITFLFTFMYLNVKLIQIKSVGMLQAFTENDHAVFSVIIGHWFGARSMQKFMRLK